MIKLDSKLGVDDKEFLEELLGHAQALAAEEASQNRFAALNGFMIRARRLLKSHNGVIPHAPNDSPAKLWADFSGALYT